MYLPVGRPNADRLERRTLMPIYLFRALWTNMNIDYLKYNLLMTSSCCKVNFQQDVSHFYAHTWVVSASWWPEYTTTDIFIIRFYYIYEYRIYSFLATWPNTDIKYIRSIRISNIRWLIFEYLNIWIYSCYTATKYKMVGPLAVLEKLKMCPILKEGCDCKQ